MKEWWENLRCGCDDINKRMIYMKSRMQSWWLKSKDDRDEI